MLKKHRHLFSIFRLHEGHLEEAEIVMHKDATAQAMDATLIAGAQKVEHYEISGCRSAAVVPTCWDTRISRSVCA
jgi:ferritin-like metal-binding protein YciE